MVHTPDNFQAGHAKIALIKETCRCSCDVGLSRIYSGGREAIGFNHHEGQNKETNRSQDSEDGLSKKKYKREEWGLFLPQALENKYYVHKMYQSYET